MGHDTLPLPHVVYQAEVVRFLLKPAPGHEGFATASSVVCSTSFLTRRTLPSRNRPTPNGCAEIAHGYCARGVLRTVAALQHSGSSWEGHIVTDANLRIFSRFCTTMPPQRRTQSRFSAAGWSMAS